MRTEARHWGPSLLFGALVFAPVLFFSQPLLPPDGKIPLGLLWAGFVAAIGVMILKTGRVSRWRSLLFIVITLGFLISFKARLLGSGRFFTSEAAQEVPYCHIALASTVLSRLYQQYLAFMSGSWKSWGPLSLGALWLVVTLALGQGWCSWVCFYGGIDDGMSRILPKPLLKWRKLPGRLRDFPFALLIFLLLISLSTLLPVFCLWICPLKLTTSFLDPVDSTRKIQMAIMIAVGTVFLVLLPVLTGKRAFCGLICPFGAWQAVFGRLNPFRVTLDHSACTGCELCVRSCPIFSIRSPDGKPEILESCNRCGECMDVCAASCIRYTILGHPLSGKGPGWTSLWDARALFVFCALVISGTLGSLFVPAALKTLIHAVKG